MVKSIASDGSDIEPAGNEIGKYSDTVPLDLTTDETLSTFEVVADGTWKIVVKVMQKATQFTGSFTGKGDNVLLAPSGTSSGFVTATITDKGQSNVAVKAYTPNDYDLLVNEIGNYSGQVIIPDGSLVFEIVAGGTWTIKLDLTTGSASRREMNGEGPHPGGTVGTFR